MAEATLSVASLSKAFDSLCKDFFCESNKSKYEDYIGLEKLSSEVLRLNLPKASDILNAAAGPGILSAFLQSHGYGNLDALDIHPEVIAKLINTGLYRNYICRNVDGANSSGLKEDVYDAVVMLGGFSPGNIAPSAISELFRITKPDGHILWTLREDYHSKHSDYGLLDENLAALERAGKCQIIKMGEKFRDPHSDLAGLLYVVKRVEQADSFDPDSIPEDTILPSIVVDTVVGAGTADAAVSAVRRSSLVGGGGRGGDAAGAAAGGGVVDFGERVDDDMVMVGQYTGHVKLCQAFFKLRLPRSVEILDVSSHMSTPGLVGMELSHNGYDCVDGMDHNLDALNIVRASGIYRHYILGGLGGHLGSIPVNPESYDVILMAGGFAPGKILPSAFNELIRILRPGGYILWTMRDGYGASDPDFALFDVRVQDLVLERKWELLVGPVFFDNFEHNHAGRFYMLRKCHREVFALGSPRHSPSSSPRLQRRRLSVK